MSRFEKLTHVLWHCQYHIVWVPKYRYRVLKGVIGQEVHNCIGVFYSQLRCRVVELNVQPDHVHLCVRVPPKVSISKLMGVVKGRTALRLFTSFPYLRKRPYCLHLPDCDKMAKLLLPVPSEKEKIPAPSEIAPCMFSLKTSRTLHHQMDFVSIRFCHRCRLFL